MAVQPKKSHNSSRTQKKTSAKLPRICANCGHWSWKSGCRFDRDAAPSRTCGRFEMGRYASYATDNRGKVVKVDPKTYNGNGAAEAVAIKKSDFTDWVVRELKKRDIAFIDNRNKKSNSGDLWVMGGNTAIMQQVMAEFTEAGAVFSFVEEGAEVTGNRPGWCLSGYPERN